MRITNASIRSLDGGPPISLGDAQITIDQGATSTNQSVKYARGDYAASFTENLAPDVAGDLLNMLNPGPKRTPCLEAIVPWDPWRNPRAFWSLMTSLLVRGGPGTRWRIRQATAADRLKGGAFA